MHKDKHQEKQLNNSKHNISRRPKAVGLQFATYVAIAIQGLAIRLLSTHCITS